MVKSRRIWQAVAILQRVASASVTIDSQVVSSIGKGVLVFAAIDRDDGSKDVESMAAKVLKMKMWPDDGGGPVCKEVKFATLSPPDEPN